MPSVDEFFAAVTHRRSTYTLSPETVISDAELQQVLETTLEQAPSTFGSFTTRVHVLVKDEHFKLCDIVAKTLKAHLGAERYAGYTADRIAGFRNAYGTIMFFEDPENTHILEEKYPSMRRHFPTWSTQTSAIHQYIIWTALTNLGLGANLQHYNPIIDDEVKETWGVPKEWKLMAQLVFGKPTEAPKPKLQAMKKPMSERLFFHGQGER